MPASLAGPRRRAPRALPVGASFDPDGVIRRQPIGVMFAGSPASRRGPPACFPAGGLETARLV